MTTVSTWTNSLSKKDIINNSKERDILESEKHDDERKFYMNNKKVRHN
jgi:hypothetical protein